MAINSNFLSSLLSGVGASANSPANNDTQNFGGGLSPAGAKMLLNLSMARGGDLTNPDGSAWHAPQIAPPQSSLDDYLKGKFSALTGGGGSSPSATGIYGPLVPQGSSDQMTPKTTPVNAPGPSSGPQASTTGNWTGDNVDAKQDQFQSKFPPRHGPSADDYLQKYDQAIAGSAAAYRQLLQNAPQYQTPHMSPWTAAALGLGGLLTNAVEPYHQNGSQMLTGALEGLQQGAEQRYAHQKDDYLQRLQNAQASYGLDKDQHQSLLDQARNAESTDSDYQRFRMQDYIDSQKLKSEHEYGDFERIAGATDQKNLNQMQIDAAKARDLQQHGWDLGHDAWQDKRDARAHQWQEQDIKKLPPQT